MVKTRKSNSLALAFVGLACSGIASQFADAKCSHDTAENGKAQYQALLKAREDNRRLNKRQSPITSLAQQMALTDPEQECSYYNYPLIDSIIANYPQVWEIAYIVPSDNEARSAYNAIITDPQFPNIPTKGTPQGDISGVPYDVRADPDCWWTMTRCDQPKHQAIPTDVNSCAEPSTWGLTYDDGPNCTHNAFYDILKQKELTATMYYIGSNVMNWPYQAQRGLYDEHEIAIHTWSHRYSTALTNEQMFAELWYTRKAIKEVIGVTPTSWRAPFGDIDDRVRFIAHKLGLTTVLWDHDTFDWRVQGPGNPNGIPTASVEANYDAVMNGAKTGDFSTHGTIVLSHEINGNTMEIAEGELDDMMENFDHVVPVAVCQNWTHPYIEQSYTFPTFAQWIAGDINATNSSSSTISTSISTLSTGSGMSGTIGAGGSTAGPTTTGTARTLGSSRAASTSSSTRGVVAQANAAKSSSQRKAGPLTAIAVLASVPILIALC